MTAQEREHAIAIAQQTLDRIYQDQTALYAEIGQATVTERGIEAFPDFQDRYRVLEAQLQTALQELKQAQEAVVEESAPNAKACPKCGRIALSDRENFCIQCGTRMTYGTDRTVFCINCGQRLTDKTIFCTNCGQRVR